MASIDAVVPASLVERIGPRRCAEIAFEEGELLALRLPDAAVPILDWASGQYAACRDAFGAFSTAALAALLGSPQPVIRERDGGHVRGRKPRRAHRRGARRVPGNGDRPRRRGVSTLATAEELEAIAAAPTDAAFDRLDPPELRPWFARLIATLAVRGATNGASGAAAADVFAAWLEQRYGVSSATGVALPTEWTRYLRKQGSGPVDATPPAAPSGGRDIATLVGTGIGLLVGLYIGWHYLVSALWSGLERLWLWQQIALYALTLGVFGLLIWGGRRFGNSMDTLTLLWTRLDVDIQPTASPGDASPGDDPRPANASTSASRGVAVTLAPTMWILRPVRGLPPLQLRPYRAYPSEVAVVSELDAYDRLATALPDGLKGLVGRCRSCDRPGRSGSRREATSSGSTGRRCSRSRGRSRERPDRPARAGDTALPTRAGPTFAASTPARSRARPSPATTYRPASCAGRSSSDLGAGHQMVAGRALDRPTPSTWPRPTSCMSWAHDEDHGGARFGSRPRAYGRRWPRRRAGPPTPGRSRSLGPRTCGAPSAGRPVHRPGIPPEETTQRVGSDREAATSPLAAELARLGSRVVVIPPLEPSLATTAWDIVNRAAPKFATGGPGACCRP